MILREHKKSCKSRINDFFRRLENRQITSIDLLTDKHIRDYRIAKSTINKIIIGDKLIVVCNLYVPKKKKDSQSLVSP